VPLIYCQGITGVVWRKHFKSFESDVCCNMVHIDVKFKAGTWMVLENELGRPVLVYSLAAGVQITWFQ